MVRPLHRRSAALVAAFFLLVSGCGGDGEDPVAHGDAAAHGDASGDGDGRVVAISAHDKMAFDPASVEVEAGETITFEVTNEGDIVHEFVLGDEDAQREHAEEMEGMDGMDHGHANSMSIEPGETESLTWTFSEPGEVLYGCHEPGHYDAGMVGTVTVR